MNTMASRNPDKKITATAALDNSQKRSMKLDTNSKHPDEVNGYEKTTDLKFCSVYVHRSKYISF